LNHFRALKERLNEITGRQSTSNELEMMRILDCCAFDPFNWLMSQTPDLSHSLSNKFFATSLWKTPHRCWGIHNTNINKAGWDGNNIVSVKIYASTLYKFEKL
jgi:hypothetical protein